MIVLGSIAKD